MEQDKKYYTPDHKELYVGYECEYDNLNKQYDEWKPITIGLCNIGDIENAQIRVRTPYLTREDIESLGWKHTGGQLVSHGRQDYETKWHILQHWPARVDNIGLSMIRIMTKEDDMVLGSYKGYDKVVYDGTCKSINELRNIIKWTVKE